MSFRSLACFRGCVRNYAGNSRTDDSPRRIVCARSRSQDRLATVSGVALGDFTAMTASLFGLGALLAASATLFTVLKWIGGAYLIWLGIKLWRAPIITGPMADNDNLPEEKSLKIFLHAYVVTALNPKSIVFFVAFVPQFLNPALPFFGQMLVMEATFLVLATINASTYALAAHAARGLIRKARCSARSIAQAAHC
jgi:threonine/homoserine/homoserine lactone efflux protein